MLQDSHIQVTHMLEITANNNARINLSTHSGLIRIAIAKLPTTLTTKISAPNTQKPLISLFFCYSCCISITSICLFLLVYHCSHAVLCLWFNRNLLTTTINVTMDCVIRLLFRLTLIFHSLARSFFRSVSILDTCASCFIDIEHYWRFWCLLVYGNRHRNDISTTTTTTRSFDEKGNGKETLN